MRCHSHWSPSKYLLSNLAYYFQLSPWHTLSLSHNHIDNVCILLLCVLPCFFSSIGSVKLSWHVQFETISQFLDPYSMGKYCFKSLLFISGHCDQYIVLFSLYFELCAVTTKYICEMPQTPFTWYWNCSIYKAPINPLGSMMFPTVFVEYAQL